jgi:hypothetical protein
MSSEWREDKASLGGLFFYFPGGAEEFSPGFQPYKHIPKNLAPRASVSIALGVWVGSP